MCDMCWRYDTVCNSSHTAGTGSASWWGTVGHLPRLCSLCPDHLPVSDSPLPPMVNICLGTSEDIYVVEIDFKNQRILVSIRYKVFAVMNELVFISFITIN